MAEDTTATRPRRLAPELFAQALVWARLERLYHGCAMTIARVAVHARGWPARQRRARRWVAGLEALRWRLAELDAAGRTTQRLLALGDGADSGNAQEVCESVAPAAAQHGTCH